MGVRLLTGDSLDMLAALEAGSIGACVTDPPYGLKFMGKAWDHGVPGVPYWQAVHRVLKPGAWLLAFGGTRTYHRLTCAIEDAGFEIRDCLSWMYGSGFPKGKGCLKPGWEPIVLARKRGPLWLNVDGCRLAPLTEAEIARSGKSTNGSIYGDLSPVDWKRDGCPAAGRWPANVVLSHDPECREVGQKRTKSNGRPNSNGKTYGGAGYGGHADAPYIARYVDPDGTETVTAWECVETCAVRMLDAQSGTLQSGGGDKGNKRSASAEQYRLHTRPWSSADYIPDIGGASRFYYCSKASTAERGQGNDHPTVKPLALMDWLVRLVTPPGETGIDPFCGSGSTLLAWDRLRFDCIGIDADPHTIGIAHGRLTRDAGVFADVAAS